jgi:hypothetical protein
MAATVLTLNPSNFPDKRDMTFNHVHIYGAISFSPGTYPAGGVPISWAGIDDINAFTISWAEFQSVGSPPGLYDYMWDKQSSTVRILTSPISSNTGTSPFSEFIAGVAMPGPILSDLIQFHAIFRRA